MEGLIMNAQSGTSRWILGLIVSLAVVLVGVGAYNLGVSHAVAINLPAAAGAAPGTGPGTPPLVVYPYAYGWHRPWGFGFLFPFLFFGFWFLVARAFFWRGRWYRHRFDYYGTHQVPPGFEEWHRRAHEQMKTGQQGS
jgi:hypothetical protein